MTMAKIALLPDRGVVSVMGDDARKLLQGVITNDMAAFDQGMAAIHAGLLTPQGKILFEFFVAAVPGGYLLETNRQSAGELARRMMLYKLRAKAEIKDVSSAHSVAVVWGDPQKSWPWQDTANTQNFCKSLVWFEDPRDRRLGQRLILTMATDWIVAEAGAEAAPADSYHVHRIALGVPQGGRDYPLGDTFPHEADFDLFAGVSFTKGCFVGQEVVARMENKSVIRKRVTGVSGSGLARDVDIKMGDVTIGTVGSVADQNGLALVRLDRVVEAIDGGLALTAGGAPIAIDADAIDRYRRSVEEKAARP
ncbi:MAG: folate-binding protein [Hyphomicrobium sp.]|nr:MAG: folate-binding protein [Hyphomicrobium sp.]